MRPAQSGGWRFLRTDRPDAPEIPVTAENIVDCHRNLELCLGDRGNNIRMTEHIIALKLGLGLDNVIIAMPSDDPPLFDVGSQPLVEAVLSHGLRELPDRRVFLTPKEPTAICGSNNAFLLFEPAAPGDHLLHLDVAIDFPTAIGKQRIQFDLHPDFFAYGAQARTNCSRKEMILARTIGLFSSRLRNFGYTRENILIAGRRDYVNTPNLLHDGKSLEAVWHRSCLDLVAALALLGDCCLAGRLSSYKSGHALDTAFVTSLRQRDLLVPVA